MTDESRPRKMARREIANSRSLSGATALYDIVRRKFNVRVSLSVGLGLDQLARPIRRKCVTIFTYEASLDANFVMGAGMKLDDLQQLLSDLDAMPLSELRQLWRQR